MASSSLPPKKKNNNRYTLSTIFLLLLFLSSLFYFSKRALEPKLSLYKDVFSQPPSVFSPRSADTELLDNTLTTPYGDTKVLKTKSETPILSKSDFDDSLDQKVTPISSEFKDTEGLKVFKKTPISDFNDNLVEKSSAPVSSEYEDASNATKKQVVDSERNEEKVVDSDFKVGGQSCDLYKGRWVKDEKHPIYKAGSCPYVDEAFDCQSNGRPDSEYLNWRWKPHGCDLPRFSATDFLKRLKGKRLMLVGDSMNRNQFESLLCLLREGLVNKSKMYEIHGYKITKGRGYYVFKFEDYNCTVEFVRSHFLVREGVRINAQGNSNPTLSIDRIDKSSNRWKKADIVVFNTGHWWTHGKTARGKNYYKEGDHVYPKFDALEAYRRALKTWAKWIDENMSHEKLIIYRGYSSAHFRGGDWDSGGSCNKETEPVSTGSILGNYPLKMKIVEEVIKEMQLPVVLLNVTQLTNFRKDGHPSVYGKVASGGRKVKQDCSHWCLPGVPDAWNELIYATLVLQQQSSVNQQ
ncbi:protein trichome birefringence-like 5 [Nicotiana sylvestris]|uniref:Protein trichome birefringence-like 5 n=1 Tax=Nicotiana sylvestris TaxID=4096 RepID=A0A1U7VFP2_NICSY|nr:PREDICTED: protein trichome birefringence-like 5 [Nicotiana sylvestris]